MNYRSTIARCILCSSISLLSACSNGPADKPLPNAITAPAYLLDRGIQHYSNNEYAEAIYSFEKALLQYRSIDDQAGIANSCLNLASSYMAINNDQTAAEYLAKANTVIRQAALTQLDEHLHLLNSSLALKKDLPDRAEQELAPVLNSTNTSIRLAALKNQTTVAFLNNAADKQQWLDRYRTLQQEHPVDSSSHRARILRFEAELKTSENSNSEISPQVLLSEALSITVEKADKPAIAATLTQWAQLDLTLGHPDEAEDKYLRALFIRHQLGDVKNSLRILEKLQGIYALTDNSKQKKANYWIRKISQHDVADWPQLFTDFDPYPATGN